MNEAVNIWIQQASAIPGVLGCGVRCADQSIITNSSDEKVSGQLMQNAFREIVDVIQVLREEQITADELCWTFEKGKVYCIVRGDGALAALVVVTELRDSPEINGLLSDFLSVQC